MIVTEQVVTLDLGSAPFDPRIDLGSWFVPTLDIGLYVDPEPGIVAAGPQGS